MWKTKFWGQNFLKNKVFLKLISRSLDLKEDDTLVEIGGGHGELTKYLLKAKKLIIYEIDEKLTLKLKEKFPEIEVRSENFLQADLEKFNHHYKLVGNIPYRITGLILKKILNLKNYPEIFVLTLQKEVGEKILKKGEFLNNWLKVWGEVKKLAFVSRKNFSPQPKVDSLILKIEFYKEPLIKEPEKFIQFLKKLYQQRKRMIRKNLDLPGKFKDLANLRPHQLSFEEIKELFNYYFKLS